MRRKRSPYAIPVMLAVAALLALLIYGVAQTHSGAGIDAAVAAGRSVPAPLRPLRPLGATRTTTLAAYRGKVVLLNFWASWCDSCKGEAPAIERAYRRYASRGFVVIGADVDDLTQDARDFARRYQMTYPIVKYDSHDAAKDFGTRALPESFVINPRGRIVALRRYQVDDAWLQRQIPRALREAGL